MEETRQNEEYLNSPSGRHYIDIDLPPHWFRYYTDDDEKEEYFFNELTGETTWEKPEFPSNMKQEVSVEENSLIEQTENLKVEENSALENLNTDGNVKENVEIEEAIKEETSTSERISENVEEENDNLGSENVGDEEGTFDKSQVITHVQNNGPKSTRELNSEPIATPVEISEATVVEPEPEPFPSHIDHFAGSGSPLLGTNPPKTVPADNYYTSSKPVISEERIRNWNGNSSVLPSSNPFADDESPPITPQPVKPTVVKASPIVRPPGSSSNRSTTASSSYSPPPPPPPAGKPIKKVSHNPFLDQSPDARYHQPHHNHVEPLVGNRQSPLTSQNSVPSRSHAPLPVTVAQPTAPTKQPSSLLLALKAEKAQHQQHQQHSKTSSLNPFGDDDVDDIKGTAVPVSRPSIQPPPPVRSNDRRKSNPIIPGEDRYSTQAISFAQPNQALTPQLIKLLQFGVKQQPAMVALQHSQNNPKLALQSIHEQILASLRVDMYASQVHIYKPRLNTRIKSWLPNYLDQKQADYHTRYVCTIAYDCLNNGAIQTWQVDFRYSSIKSLYHVVQKYQAEINAICPLIEAFPLASFSHGLFGISDADRTERMNKFDLWIREVIMNPLAMTIWEIVEAVYQFLEFYKHIIET